MRLIQSGLDDPDREAGVAQARLAGGLLDQLVSVRDHEHAPAEPIRFRQRLDPHAL